MLVYSILIGKHALQGNDNCLCSYAEWESTENILGVLSKAANMEDEGGKGGRKDQNSFVVLLNQIHPFVVLQIKAMHK